MATPGKRAPSVLVPCSIKNPNPARPGEAEVFGDATLRGVWLGLAVIAWQARAGANGGQVLLSDGDRLWVGGVSSASRVGRRVSTRVSEADARVARVCHLMGISVSVRGQYWALQWHRVDTDLSEKLNDSEESTARISPKNAPSEVRNQNQKKKSEERMKKRQKAAAPPVCVPFAVAQNPEPADSDRLPEEAPTDEQAKAAKEKLAVDVGRALNVLADQQGGLEEKRLWLTANLRACEAWCKDNGRQFRAGLLSWWRNYASKPERPFREIVRKEALKAQIRKECAAIGLDPYAPAVTPDAPPEMVEQFLRNNCASIGGRR